MSSVPQAPARAKGHVDPVGAFVPVQTRSERPRSYNPADFGAPTGREVNWKHTPVVALRALIQPDALAEAANTEIRTADPRVTITQQDAGARSPGDVFIPEDIVAAQAARFGRTTLTIPADAEIDDPIWIEVRCAASPSFAHLIIDAGTHSRATVVIDHQGAGTLAENVEVQVRGGASLNLITVQRWDESAVHVASHQVRVDADASLTHIVATVGGRVVRVNPSIDLAGAGSHGKLYGFSFADAGRHCENQVFLHHRGPHTSGDVLYKNALQGEGARTVWIGDVLIGPDAIGTDSYEANRNLVLTEHARADSIPNLEIETGDIVGAGHASATGRFDDEQVFYLLSRGIPDAQARRLVVVGFLAEIVQKVGLPELEADLSARIEDLLESGSAA